MGRFAKVIISERRTKRDGAEIVEIRADIGGNDTHACELYQPSGDDAIPLPGDFVELEPGVESGTWVVVGVHDRRNRGTAAAGEKRLYARDEDGNPVCEIWLKGDGTLAIDADVSVELTAPVVTLNSPDVRLSDAAGQGVARIGDLVAVTVTTAPGTAAGQIISGTSKVKA